MDDSNNLLSEDKYNKLIHEFKIRIYKMITSIAYEKFEKNYCKFNTYKKIKYYCDTLSEDQNGNFELKLYYQFTEDSDNFFYKRYLFWLRNIPVIGHIFRK